MCTVHCSGRVSGGGVCLGGVCSWEGGGVSARPPWAESQTGVDTLLCRNYVANGKNVTCKQTFITQPQDEDVQTIRRCFGVKSSIAMEMLFSLVLRRRRKQRIVLNRCERALSPAAEETFFVTTCYAWFNHLHSSRNCSQGAKCFFHNLPSLMW